MTVKIRTRWMREDALAHDALEATMSTLQIHINNTNATEYTEQTGKVRYALQIPNYYLAEWLAENWWPLLYEPRKSEEDSDATFSTRHSLLGAQHGFPLPAITIVPVGRAVSVNALPRGASLAKVRFKNRAETTLTHEAISEELAEFIDGCVARLVGAGVTGTPLEKAWRKVKDTKEDEVLFCRLVGSLGLCPYAVDDETASAIDLLHDSVGARAARDFCLAATPDQLLKSARAAGRVVERMSSTAPSTLNPLEQVRLPTETMNAPSWRRGVQAAKNVRTEFDIRPSDTRGADKLFEVLRIDPDQRPSDIGSEDVGLPFSAAVDRQNSDTKFALLQAGGEQRRFAAGRAIYLAWSSERDSRRLITDALTRDQQASRAFAAEILVPSEYLKSEASGQRLRSEQVHEIARSRRASATVVRYQANNNGILIRPF